jgi:hypothetical protein
MLPFGVTIPVTAPQRSEIPEGLMNNPVLNNVLYFTKIRLCVIVMVLVEVKITP